MVIEAMGYAAQFGFVLASFLQARKVYIEGHANGLSYGLLLPLIVCFVIMLIYVPIKIGLDVVLLSGYVGQLICVSFMMYYKLKPRIQINVLQDMVDEITEDNKPKDELWEWDEGLGQYVDKKRGKY